MAAIKVTGLICGIIFIFSTFVANVVCEDFPANEYEFSVRRDWLIEAEKRFAGKDGDLNEDEHIVDSYLKYLKYTEFEATKSGDFPAMMPTEDVMENITSSDLYGILRTLPKGGNMHSHENHQLSKKTLLEIVWESEDFEHLYMLPEDHPTDPWMLDFFIEPPNEEWVNVQDSNYTFDDILQQQTFLGIMNDEAKARITDTGLRWQELNPLWMRGTTQLIANYNIKLRYVEELLRSSLDEGVQYLETRKSLSSGEWLYVLDPNETENNGKRIIDDNEGELDIKLTLEIRDNITAEHPEFIDIRRIVYTHRMNSDEDINKDADRVLKFREMFPDHILGFDMVGEEDAGNSHLFYVGPLTGLYDPETRESKVPLYLHATETNWPEDLISSINDADPVSTLQNAYEVLLLNPKRIGHGLGYIKHPYLLDLIKEKNIPIESCIVSNQLLGYTPDLRNHPALHFYRMGIPVVLGSDDPGTFGVDEFTLDWFQAYIGWGLDLADLRTFAVNSLRYSSMTDAQKDMAIHEKWLPQWEKFIMKTKDLACNMNHTLSSDPSFARIFPREGALSGTTKVHVFGRHFESAICKQVHCKFGEFDATNGYYVSQNHIICDAPDPATADELQVHVEVSLDGGASFVKLNETFTYRYEPFTTTIVPPATTVSGSNHVAMVSWMIGVIGLLMAVMVN